MIKNVMHKVFGCRPFSVATAHVCGGFDMWTEYKCNHCGRTYNK